MGELISPQNTIAVLQNYRLKFQKKYGQNFLIDAHVMHKIIESAQVTGEDFNPQYYVDYLIEKYSQIYHIDR